MPDQRTDEEWEADMSIDRGDTVGWEHVEDDPRCNCKAGDKLCPVHDDVTPEEQNARAEHTGGLKAAILDAATWGEVKRLPGGWWGVNVFTNGDEIVLTGTPWRDFPSRHNCDEMGCGTLDHVLYRFPASGAPASDDALDPRMATDSMGVDFSDQPVSDDVMAQDWKIATEICDSFGIDREAVPRAAEKIARGRVQKEREPVASDVIEEAETWLEKHGGEIRRDKVFAALLSGASMIERLLAALRANLEKVCPRCDGLRWVCENHHDVPWAGLSGDEECCGGAGEPCPDCNPANVLEEATRLRSRLEELERRVYMQPPTANIEGVTWEDAYFAVKSELHDVIADRSELRDALQTIENLPNEERCEYCPEGEDTAFDSRHDVYCAPEIARRAREGREDARG